MASRRVPARHALGSLYAPVTRIALPLQFLEIGLRKEQISISKILMSVRVGGYHDLHYARPVRWGLLISGRAVRLSSWHAIGTLIDGRFRRRAYRDDRRVRTDKKDMTAWRTNAQSQ
jgi:hypothetical protein